MKSRKPQAFTERLRSHAEAGKTRLGKGGVKPRRRVLHNTKITNSKKEKVKVKIASLSTQKRGEFESGKIPGRKRGGLNGTQSESKFIKIKASKEDVASQSPPPVEFKTVMELQTFWMARFYAHFSKYKNPLWAERERKSARIFISTHFGTPYYADLPEMIEDVLAQWLLYRNYVRSQVGSHSTGDTPDFWTFCNHFDYFFNCYYENDKNRERLLKRQEQMFAAGLVDEGGHRII